MGKLVQMLGSGVGLVSEAMAARKESKSPAPTTTNNYTSSSTQHPQSQSQHPYYNNEAPPQYVELPDDHANRLIAEGHAVSVDSAAGHDEQDWALDEAAHPPDAYDQDDDGKPPTAEQVKHMTADFLRRHPPPRHAVQPLPLPVIIPQRRPRDKKRGFVRAYAPVLEGCDIDEKTFMEFLKTFHASTRESQALHVVNAAAQGAGMVPSPIAMGVSIGMQVVAGVAMEAQRRGKQNTFLDTLNNEFFKPRGLYALVMTYQPDDPRPARRINVAGKIENTFSTPVQAGDHTYEDHVQRRMDRPEGQSKYRLSDGKTFGELELPEAAPLIYPELDRKLAGEGKDNYTKTWGRFIDDYKDKRAQAQFANEGLSGEGNSRLAQTNPAAFKSALGDPNHKAYQGGLIGLVTGGAYDPRSKLKERRAVRRGEDPEDARRNQGGIRGRKQDTFVKKIIKKNVLYLLIVSLPGEQAMADGREIVAREGTGDYDVKPGIRVG